MRKTDARIFYLEDTVPYKDGYMTLIMVVILKIL